MSHAAHFLQRLERASATQAELALSLYRDTKALRYVLDSTRPKRTPDARLALSLAPGDEGPFVMVNGGGEFITCLGRGMTLSGAVLVPFPAVQSALRELHEYRDRISLAADMAGGEQHIGRLVKRLYTRADDLSREEFKAISVMQPFCKHDFLRRQFLLASELEGLRAQLNRLDRVAPRLEPLLRITWETTWAMAHMMVLSVLDGSRGLPPAVMEMLEPLPPFGWHAFRLADSVLAARATWAAGRMGKRLFASVEASYRAAKTPLSFLSSLSALLVLGLRYRHLRRRAAETMVAKRNFSPALSAWLRKAGTDTFFTEAILVLEDPEQVRASYVQWSAQVACVVGKELKLRPPYRWERPEEVPPELGCSLAANLSGDFLNKPEYIRTLMRMIPWLASVDATELFLPQALADGISEWSAEHALKFFHRVQDYQGKPAPVRAAAPPGRNVPCPCGSGKKFKHCCVDKPRPAQGTRKDAPRATAAVPASSSAITPVASPPPSSATSTARAAGAVMPSPSSLAAS